MPRDIEKLIKWLKGKGFKLPDDIDKLIRCLCGKSYKLFCALKKTGAFDRAQVRALCRILPPKTRLLVKKRMIMYLLEQRYRHGRLRFLRAWRRSTPQTRRNILKLFCERHLGVKPHSMYSLLSKILEQGMPNRKDFLYIWKPVRGRTRDQMKILWFAYLCEGCEFVRAIKTGNDAVIEVRISRDPTSPTFCF